MKIVRIGVENLNSLYGRHEVDFERDLGDAPLFVILGPTGAGKSTLLDAICLALFGQTPRLPSGRQKPEPDAELPPDDSRRIMSEGTAHCRAEVEFTKVETSGRERYRAIWTCQRARKKAGGNLQSPARTLERWDPSAKEWRQLGGGRQLKHFEEAFHEALEGLGVEDFKRSALLAQGEFAALLQADEKARADLLERLTGTDIYKRIGQIAALRWRAAQRELEKADAALGAAHPLSVEQVAALESRQAELGDAIRNQTEARDARRKRIDWFKTGQELGARLAQALGMARAAELALEAASPDLSRLAEHDRSAPAAEVLREVERVERALRPIDESLPGLEEEAQRTSELGEAAERAAVAAAARYRQERSALDAARPVIGRARELRNAEAEYGRRRTDRDAARAALARQNAELGELAGQIETRRVELADLGDGRELEVLLPGIERRLGARAERLGELRALQADLETLPNGHDVAEEARLARSEFEQIRERRELAERALRDLADDVPAERQRISAEIEGIQELLTLRKRTLEVSLKVLEWEVKLSEQHAVMARGADEFEAAKAGLDRWIRQEETAQFARARRALVPGAPCPVCGSESHPAARVPLESGEVDEAATRRAREQHDLANQAFVAARTRFEDWVQVQMRTREELGALIGRLGLPLDATLAEVDEAGRSTEKLRREVEVRRDALDLADAAVRHASVEERRAREACDAAEARVRGIEELAGRMAGVSGEIERIERELRGELGILAADQELDQAVAKARALLGRWREATDAVSALEGTMNLVAIEIAKSESTLRQADFEAAKAKELLDRAANELGDAGRAVGEIEDLDAYERRLEETVTAADALRAESAQSAEKVKIDLAAARARLGETRTRKIELTQELDLARRALGERLRELGLHDEAALLARLLDGSAIETLRQRKNELERALTAAEAQARAQADSVRDHESRRAVDAPGDLEALAAEERALVEDERGLGDLQKELGAVQNQLVQHAAELERHAEAWEIRAERARAFDRANRLHQLVGVSDGDRFKRFAQVLNLEDLVRRANSHLEHLAPRYALVPARGPGGEPTLDFAVRDHYQAESERPTKTLSGGETFLVSLALALALSSYRAIRMPIETLLLDEGFGTLDRSALDIAIGALEQLHAGGTRVGIISHVEALRERVAARIVVQRLGNGRSRLEVEVG
jgi:exonuclease SbcC